MPELINKKSIEHLAELARLELSPKEEEKYIKDLGEILDYFKELQTVDTTGVKPMTGGTDLKNITREDKAGKNHNTGKGKDMFPDKQGDFLKVPNVF